MIGMSIPFDTPVRPMLAKARSAVPTGDARYLYEPKWDGFRCVLVKDGDRVDLDSRGSKPLTRYFPELVAAAREHLPQRCVLDGEIVVRDPSGSRLSFERLGQRIHPAASRVERLSQDTPAEMVFFDCLWDGVVDLMPEPFAGRRARMEQLLGGLGTNTPFHLTRTTDDARLAQQWFERFEGAGLDGVVAKDADSPYEPGRRSMLKVKHSRTAEAVLVGYRVHKSGTGVGSLLLGMYDSDGELRNVGGIVSFTAQRRLELVDELAPSVVRDEHGDAVHGETDRSRFAGAKDVTFVQLRPERVVEVKFDQLEGLRFRHGVSFLRWRPDRDPRSCLLDQVERAPAYDLAEVLGGV